MLLQANEVAYEPTNIHDNPSSIVDDLHQVSHNQQCYILPVSPDSSSGDRNGAIESKQCNTVHVLLRGSFRHVTIKCQLATEVPIAWVGIR
jgi:hypothetical protein